MTKQTTYHLQKDDRPRDNQHDMYVSKMGNPGHSAQKIAMKFRSTLLQDVEPFYLPEDETQKNLPDLYDRTVVDRVCRAINSSRLRGDKWWATYAGDMLNGPMPIAYAKLSPRVPFNTTHGPFNVRADFALGCKDELRGDVVAMMIDASMEHSFPGVHLVTDVVRDGSLQSVLEELHFEPKEDRSPLIIDGIEVPMMRMESLAMGSLRTILRREKPFLEETTDVPDWVFSSNPAI